MSHYRQQEIQAKLEQLPVVVLLGPREAGKTTLIGRIAAGRIPINPSKLSV